MKRLFISALSLLLAAAPASAQMMSTGIGGGGFGGGAAGYVGPGDVKSGADSWWGLRGYTAAYSTGGNPAIDIVDQAGANPLTVNILANGSLDVATVSTWVTAHSVTTIKISKLYDQTARADHLIQATLASMPVLTLSAVGSLPGMTFAGSQEMNTALGSGGLTSTGSFSVVVKRTGNTSAFNGIVSAGNYGPGYNNAADQGILFQGSVSASYGLTDNAFHALQSVFNSSSSISYMDGTSNTGLNPGSTSFGAQYNLGKFNGSLYLTGVMCEVGAWNLLFSGGEQAAMNSNQHAYWGF